MRQQPNPETKYHVYPNTSACHMGKLACPLSEAVITVRAGWFITPPRPRFQPGDVLILKPATGPFKKEEEAKPYRLMSLGFSERFPLTSCPEDFYMVVGNLGPYLKSDRVSFLFDAEKIAGLMEEAVKDMRKGLESKEAELGGFEVLDAYNKERYELERRLNQLLNPPISLGSASQLRTFLRTMSYLREIAFRMALKGYPITRKQSFEERRLRDEIEKLSPYLRPYHQLKVMAQEIMNVISCCNTSLNCFAIAVPGSMKTISPVAARFHFMKKESPYACIVDFPGRPEYHIERNSRTQTLYLGNELTITIEPLDQCR